MLFLTALCTTVGAAFLSNRVGHVFPELTVGCLTVALFALVITLVSAPWEIQLGLVLVAVLSYRSLNQAEG